VRTRAILPLAFVTVALVAAACGGSASGSPLSMQIASPHGGATVRQPFTVHVNANVPLGDPSTGDHHVHLCFDGGSCDTEYTLVYGNTIRVDGLSAGTHTITASLRNADHSAAGPTDTITVTVANAGATDATGTDGGASAGGSSGSTGSSGSGSHYGY
jgi:hypothetical protein